VWGRRWGRNRHRRDRARGRWGIKGELNDLGAWERGGGWGRRVVKTSFMKDHVFGQDDAPAFREKDAIAFGLLVIANKHATVSPRSQLGPSRFDVHKTHTTKDPERV
jgi:hypothetical protein